MNDNSFRLPETDVHWQMVSSYIEREPVPEYRHAPPEAIEAFRDLKYGVRIHWGIYSVLSLAGESWPFLKMTNEERQRYQETYKTWNPTGFDAEEWMELFRGAGLKCFAFTAKHHEGFSMYDTRTGVARRANWNAPGGPRIEHCDLAYSIMETPFGRDVVRELCDAARKRDIKIDLYFSHPDWYDADFRPYTYHPLQTESARNNPRLYGDTYAKTPRPTMAPEPTVEETDRMLRRHRSQLVELVTNYGPIDMICLDMWMGELVWPHMRETMKLLREIQPDVMFRARGIGNYGDYYTPESFVPSSKENTEMPWMVIYPLGTSMSWEPDPANYKGGAWIIENLVDCAAKGGNFMVGIGPGPDGRFHPRAVEQLEHAGAWLKVNGEGIYGTRPRAGDQWKEGDHIRFTQARDAKTVYAFALQPPEGTLALESVRARPGSQVRMPGIDKPLAWRQHARALVIEPPEAPAGDLVADMPRVFEIATE